MRPLAKHAPGWSWRRESAGRIARPWTNLTAHLGGLCESGWHDDCPQAPNPPSGALGTCTCDCHQRADDPRDLLDLIPAEDAPTTVITQRIAEGAWAVLTDGERLGLVVGARELGYEAQRRIHHAEMPLTREEYLHRRNLGTFPTRQAAVDAVTAAATAALRAVTS